MTFYDQMVQLRNMAAAIAPTFGVPKVRNVYIRKLVGDIYTTVLITPTPFIDETKYDLENISSLSNLQGMARVLEVKGVSKTYLRQDLEAEDVDFVIDGIDNTPQLYCSLLQITDNGLTWTLQLKQEQGQQQVYDYD